MLFSEFSRVVFTPKDPKSTLAEQYRRHFTRLVSLETKRARVSETILIYLLNPAGCSDQLTSLRQRRAQLSRSIIRERERLDLIARDQGKRGVCEEEVSFRVMEALKHDGSGVQ